MAFYRKKYDIIVVGAGHAGCEAALSVARMGCSVLLLAIDLDIVAAMPCSPSPPVRIRCARKMERAQQRKTYLATGSVVRSRTISDLAYRSSSS